MAKQGTVRYIQDVVALAGSTTKLAALLNIHSYTVDNWRRSGIPQKYWDTLIKLYNITPAELYSITKSCRKSVTNPSRTK